MCSRRTWFASVSTMATCSGGANPTRGWKLRRGRSRSKAMFHVVMNCGPCEAFVARSIASVRAQSVPDWRLWVTVDPCGDNTYEEALGASGGDPRIHVHRNPVRRFTMENLI